MFLFYINPAVVGLTERASLWLKPLIHLFEPGLQLSWKSQNLRLDFKTVRPVFYNSTTEDNDETELKNQKVSDRSSIDTLQTAE